MPRLRRPTPAIEANLTPLIDLSFLLVVFFVLVVRISSTERTPLALPSPKHSVAARQGEEPRTVVNVLPKGDARGAYLVAGERFEDDAAGWSALESLVQSAYLATPSNEIQVRADRSAPYERVAPILALVERAADAASARLGTTIAPRVQIVVLDDQGSRP
jgi:biopolymer transport protein ExbD